MKNENSEINGRADPVLAFTFQKGGTFNMLTHNDETQEWKPSGVETIESGYVINLPVSITMTELKDRGNYELAYQDTDYLPMVFNGTETADLKWWQELIVQHSTNVDWISHHSGDLT